MSTHNNVHPIFARILATMNGSHELSAEQRAELAKPMHADVRRHLDSPAPVPTATKAVAEDGAFSLSDNQRDSLRRMALIAASTGDFSLMFGQIELLVSSALFDRSIADGRKAIGEVFRHVRGQMGGDE